MSSVFTLSIIYQYLPSTGNTTVITTDSFCLHGADNSVDLEQKLNSLMDQERNTYFEVRYNKSWSGMCVFVCVE